MSTALITKESLIAKGTHNWDRRKTGKAIIVSGIIAAVLFFFGQDLANMAWNAVSITVAGAILVGLWFVLSNKTFQRRCGYLLDVFNNLLFGWIVSMDPFVIQEGHIEDAEKESQVMLQKKADVEKEYQKTIKEVEESKRDAIKAGKSMNLAIQSNDESNAKSFGLEQSRHQTFVDVMEPMAKDMKFIIDFSGEVYKSIQENIKEAKADLKASKRLYESAMNSNAVLQSARKAFFGDAAKNAELEKARESVKERIALSVGQMRTSMEVLNEAMTQKNYSDRAKFEMMKEQLQQINAGTVPTINIDQFQTKTATPIPVKKTNTGSGTSFEDLLK